MGAAAPHWMAPRQWAWGSAAGVKQGYRRLSSHSMGSRATTWAPLGVHRMESRGRRERARAAGAGPAQHPLLAPPLLRTPDPARIGPGAEAGAEPGTGPFSPSSHGQEVQLVMSPETQELEKERSLGCFTGGNVSPQIHVLKPNPQDLRTGPYLESAVTDIKLK